MGSQSWLTTCAPGAIRKQAQNSSSEGMSAQKGHKQLVSVTTLIEMQSDYITVCICNSLQQDQDVRMH